VISQFPRVPYDVLNDFAPISLLATSPGGASVEAR
jgi:hypothetical protein